MLEGGHTCAVQTVEAEQVDAIAYVAWEIYCTECEHVGHGRAMLEMVRVDTEKQQFTVTAVVACSNCDTVVSRAGVTIHG